MRISYAIVFASDMTQAVSFYRDVLGLPLKFESAGWTEFATGGATLALHQTEAPGSVAGGPHPARPGLCRPGLRVPDLDAFHHRMIENNVRCVQDPKETFGARIAQYADPDGLVISLSEE